jgi:hypothetical protein
MHFADEHSNHDPLDLIEAHLVRAKNSTTRIEARSPTTATSAGSAGGLIGTSLFMGGPFPVRSRASHKVSRRLQSRRSRRSRELVRMSAFHHPPEPSALGESNGRIGAGRAIPSAKAEWPRSADCRPSRPRLGTGRFDPNRSFAAPCTSRPAGDSTADGFGSFDPHTALPTSANLGVRSVGTVSRRVSSARCPPSRRDPCCRRGGYSRLMGADEESALVALKGAARACRSENRRSVMSAVQGKNSVGREAQCDF